MTNTTPNTVTSSMNAGQMITRAYRMLGVLPSGGSPTADQMNQGIIVLNYMLKSWQADGINLWRQTQYTISVPAGQGSFDTPVMVTPPVLGVENARLITSQSPFMTRPLKITAYNDYMLYPNPKQQSSPTIIVFDKQENTSNFYVWPLPQTPCQIIMTVGRPILDVTQASDTIDVPIEWNMTAVYCLADHLMDDEAGAMSDPATAQRITDKAVNLYQKLLNFDRPTSLYIRPFGKSGTGLQQYPW